MFNHKQFQKNLDEIVTSMYPSRRDLSRKMGRANNQVQEWIKGDSVPSISILAELCSYLECEPNDLMKNTWENSLTDADRKEIAEYQAQLQKGKKQ